MEIIVNDNFVNDYFNINCPNSINNHVCNDTIFRCDNDNNDNEEITYLSFNSSQNEWQCKDQLSTHCCPWLSGSIPSGTDTDDTDITPSPANNG